MPSVARAQSPAAAAARPDITGRSGMAKKLMPAAKAMKPAVMSGRDGASMAASSLIGSWMWEYPAWRVPRADQAATNATGPAIPPKAIQRSVEVRCWPILGITQSHHDQDLGGDDARHRPELHAEAIDRELQHPAADRRGPRGPPLLRRRADRGGPRGRSRHSPWGHLRRGRW